MRPRSEASARLLMPRSTEPPPAPAEYPWPVCASRALAKQAPPAAPLLRDKGKRELLQHRDDRHEQRARKRHFRWHPVPLRAIRVEQPSSRAASTAALSPYNQQKEYRGEARNSQGP